MRVVVYFPPNLVGLNMSDCTVAMAMGHVNRDASSMLGFVLRHVDGTACLQVSARPCRKT